MLWGSWLSGLLRGGSPRPAAAAAETAGLRRPRDSRPGREPETVVLAHEPSFGLGGLQVRPTSLEVILPGRRELLEPRVMQVLTLLARLRGEVVARNDLILACWDGRIVGDDAINRCISRIRKLALASRAFEIQTIPRVGFRLMEAAGAEASEPRIPRAKMLAVIAAVLVATALAGWAWRSGGSTPSSRPTRVAVEPFTAIAPAAETRALAAEFRDRLSGVLTQNVVGLSIAPAETPSRDADLRLAGVVAREAGSLRVRVTLHETRQDVTLWTGEFERPAAEATALSEAAAVAAADVVDDAVDVLRSPGWKPNPISLALYLKARKAYQNANAMNRGEPRRLLEEALARSPDFVAAHAMLAIVLTSESASAGAEGRSLTQRARGEAEEAIRRDHGSAGAAYDALYIMARLKAPDDLAPAEDVIVEGQAKAPNFAFLHMRRCQFLVEVGRAREAIRHCQRALALKPLAAPLGFTHAIALYASGAVELAMRTIDSAARFRPDHELTQRRRFEIYAFSGTPEAARALLHDPAKAGACVCGLAVGSAGQRALDAFLDARVSKAPGDIDRAMEALAAAEERGVLPVRYLVFGATTLGRVDTAFAILGRLANQPGSLGAGDLQSLLTDPPAAPLNRDSRFWPLAARAGLVAYWRQRNVWPDFCGDRTLPYDCRAEAAKTAPAAAVAANRG